MRKCKKLKFDEVKIFIIRHGETIANKKGLIGCLNDEPLTSKGVLQAIALSNFLKTERIDFAYSSPFTRAKETANIILKNHKDITLKIESNLRDIDHGLCTLKKYEQIMKEFPKLVEGWKNLTDPPFPEGESLRDVQRRIMPFISKIMKKHRGKTILISSHATPNIAIIGRLLHIPPGYCWKIEQNNCCINEIILKEDEFIIKRINYCLDLNKF